MRLVLASESQSRRRALDLLGIAYEVHPSAIDEKSIRDADPAVLTTKLAEAKAWKIANTFKDAVVVAGDAVVVKDEKISRSLATSRRRRSSLPSYPAAASDS